MKLFLSLSFLYLLVPSSGLLMWDGIPFSTRSEFASLILVIVTLFSKNSRRFLLETSGRIRLSALLTPALVLLCVIKLMTFAWLPLSAGFAACYRSIYEPLADEQACEKSFEAPFIQGHGLPIAQISRVDSEVNFGSNMYDWRLPFMNEFHRFPGQWLSRFPFSARYEARIETNQEDRSYLPIRAIGELSVRVDDKTLLRESNYNREYLAVVRLPRDTSNLQVKFRFTDDDVARLPEVAPSYRGPYAQLKIGEPQSKDRLLSQARVLLLGQFQGGTTIQSISDLSVNDSFGRPISFVDKRLDSESAEGSQTRGDLFEFELEIQAKTLESGPVSLRGVVNSRSVLLATIDNKSENPFAAVAQKGDIPEIDVSAMFTVDPDSLPALRPGPPAENSEMFHVLLILLDLAAIAICAFLAVALIRGCSSYLVKSLMLGAAGWFTVYPLYELLPPALGGGRELVIPYLIAAALIVSLRRSIAHSSLVMLLPVSTVLAVQKVFDHLTYNHPGEGNRWWGKLIFMWRDSDWYVNHGNARQVFVDSFLRGGEDVFWARTGPRYLIFLFQFLLGENDILIGIISLAVGFLVLFLLVTRLAILHDGRFGRLIAFLSAFLGMILLGDQIITAFGFLVTSEFTTWVGIFGVLTFLLNEAKEQRLWVTNLFAALVASLVHFRPNILFVCLAFLALIVLKISRDNSIHAAKQFSWAVAIFAAIIPLSLIHNLYYGGRFVPFTENSAETVAIHKRFSWLQIWSELGFEQAISVIWEQLRIIMYWNLPSDPNLTIAFWGSQLLLLAALLMRQKHGVLFQAKTLKALLPISYVAPMVSYNLVSYYPRHIVTASLLCLGAALLIWPDSKNHRLESPASDAAQCSTS